MKQIVVLLFIIVSMSCNETQNDINAERAAINKLLNQWHAAASVADYNGYFSLMADDAVFIGTDATENWDKKAFMVWSKPYFDKGKAWHFKTMERHIFFNERQTVAWFDELLDTQMKICRGSGVLTKTGNEWKIKQYVLSMTMPNDSVDAAIMLKAPIEDKIISKSKSTE